MMRLYCICHALIHGDTNGIYNSDGLLGLLICFSPNVRLSRVPVQSIPIQFTDGIIFRLLKFPLEPLSSLSSLQVYNPSFSHPHHA